MKYKTKIIVAVIAAIGTILSGGFAGFAISNNINNSVVVNVNGEAVDVDKSNSDDLQKIIDDLEMQNEELTKENKKLSSETESSISVILQDVELIIDGIKSDVNSANSVAVIDGKNYYSEPFVMELIENKELSVDLENEKAYYGNKKVESAKLIDICPSPVVSSDYSIKVLDEAINMGCEPYYEGFSISSSYGDEEFAIFNIKGDYTNLKFLVGHIDGTDMHSGILKVYVCDDSGKFTKAPVKTITINPEDLPQEISVDLNYAKQVKFEMASKDGRVSWGLVDLYLD